MVLERLVWAARRTGRGERWEGRKWCQRAIAAQLELERGVMTDPEAVPRPPVLTVIDHQPTSTSTAFASDQLAKSLHDPDRLWTDFNPPVRLGDRIKVRRGSRQEEGWSGGDLGEGEVEGGGGGSVGDEEFVERRWLRIIG